MAENGGAARWWWSLALCLLTIAVWAARPHGVDPPAQTRSDFDDKAAIARLERILGDERPHPVDSEANDALRARLIAEIEALGFKPEIRDRFHCNDVRAGAAICARVRNILFWVTPPGADAVMLASHYDSVAAGPGAADDGMGVAVSLETAAILKRAKPARPVLVAITDGEEAGLVGAAQFAANDPLAKQVGAVVNLEARGTSGSANMFQTSTPNGHDIAALQAGGATPSANAIATDLYALLPNDTDLTMLLPLGVDAANYAVIGSGSRYHTPLDNLAHLDRASFRHMGASALSAMRGFARTGGSEQVKEAEGQVVFADLGKRIFLTLPKAGAALALALGLAAAAILYLRARPGQSVRTALAPPLALILGTGLAVAATMAIAALRPELFFATAHPLALRIAQAAAALAGASFAVRLLRIESGAKLAAAGWAWLTAILLALFALVPGLSTLAAWPAIPVIAAAAASFHPAARRAIPWLLGAAAILYAAIALPVAGGAEDGLFIEFAAPVTALLVFLFLFAMPTGQATAGLRGWLAPALCAAILLAAGIAAATVSAFSTDRPRALSIVHQDDGGKGSFLFYANGPVPSAMAGAARFAATPDKDGYWHAPAPTLPDEGAVRVLSDTTQGTARTIRLLAEAPQADRQEFLVERGSGVRQVIVNGAQPKVKPPLSYIGCSGRACRTLDITLVLDAQAPLPQLSWRRRMLGAGSAAAALVQARPADAQPIHDGDHRILIRPIALPTP